MRLPRLAPLDRKLLRDLWGIRGQAAAIALVIGAGVAMFVLILSTFDSLSLTQRTYYERYRFADVFAGAKRAPGWVEEEIAAIPGVAQVDTRVVADVTLDVPGLVRPASGRLISIPPVRRPILNDLFLLEGRWIEPGARDEVLASEAFARANGLGPGDSVTAVMNGRKRRLAIVGLALTPEYIYAIRPGQLISDDELFGVLWMERRALAAAFDMEGGFNDVALTLGHGASTDEVIARLDRILEPWGGLGAIPRALQPSHFYLQSEIDGLAGTGAIVPVIFLAVAAFLLNVVLNRTVALQRGQIAILKAMGYSDRAVGMHYVKWALAVAVAGTAAGLAAGAWMGAGMTRMYTDFFHFPILEYRLAPSLMAQAVLVSLGAAVAGALAAVRRVVKLPPAEAMHGEPPARYRRTWLERAGLAGWVGEPTRIVLRNLQRNPGRASLSVLGIAFGGAMIIVGSFTLDSVERMLDLQFGLVERQDATLTFAEPVSAGAIHEAARLPGVMRAEPFRSLPVRLIHGHRSRNTAITGLPAGGTLRRVVDSSQAAVTLPPGGLVLSAKLAELLVAGPGDLLTVEVLSESRPRRRVTVAAVVDEAMGTNAYMEIGAVHRLMREGGTLSGAYLLVDEARVDELYSRVKATPVVAGVALSDAALEAVEDTIAESFAMTRTVTVTFAMIIAFGVIYNGARISLSERSRELATLRVIGFRHGEIAYILLAELALLTLAAVPLGIAIGYGMAAWVVQIYDTEVYRLPLVISGRTSALSAITVIASTVLSALAVRRKLGRLDLIGVLKTRE